MSVILQKKYFHLEISWLYFFHIYIFLTLQFLFHVHNRFWMFEFLHFVWSISLNHVHRKVYISYMFVVDVSNLFYEFFQIRRTTTSRPRPPPPTASRRRTTTTQRPTTRRPATRRPPPTPRQSPLKSGCPTNFQVSKNNHSN